MSLICDKCGRIIKENMEDYGVFDYPLCVSMAIGMNSAHICTECTDEFTKWLGVGE